MIVAAVAVLLADCMLFDVVGFGATVDLEVMAFAGLGGLKEDREKAALGGILSVRDLNILHGEKNVGG